MRGASHRFGTQIWQQVRLKALRFSPLHPARYSRKVRRRTDRTTRTRTRNANTQYVRTVQQGAERTRCAPARGPAGGLSEGACAAGAARRGGNGDDDGGGDGSGNGDGDGDGDGSGDGDGDGSGDGDGDGDAGDGGGGGAMRRRCAPARGACAAGAARRGGRCRGLCDGRRWRWWMRRWRWMRRQRWMRR